MKTLNTIVQEELNLYLTTWNYHWNVEGGQFAALHKLFEEQYGALQGLIDELAERGRALGGRVETNASLHLHGAEDAGAMLRALAEAHEKLSRRMRQEWIPEYERGGDPGTVDLLTRAVQEHDKMAWMLRASA